MLKAAGSATVTQTRIRSEWSGSPVRQFRTGVSLHSHTQHSRESLAFILELSQRLPLLGSLLEHATPVDARRVWWTPPCTPYDAWRLESNQIEDKLQLKALVSLTDHDNIEAPLSLRGLVPISVEWTVPYCGTFFHLGVHNIPGATATQMFRSLAAVTAGKDHVDPRELLAALARNPETLIVFNHPCWDEKGIGADRHTETIGYFVRRYGGFIHALELNGLRPWKENTDVLHLANALGKPVISGGDRHGLEPNTILDLTTAANFSEYVEQVRSGWTHIHITNQYRENFGLRMLRTIGEVLADSWADRVFYHCDDGAARSLTQLFPGAAPHALRAVINTAALVRYATVQKTFRLVMTPQQKFAI